MTISTRQFCDVYNTTCLVYSNWNLIRYVTNFRYCFITPIWNTCMLAFIWIGLLFSIKSYINATVILENNTTCKHFICIFTVLNLQYLTITLSVIAINHMTNKTSRNVTGKLPFKNFSRSTIKCWHLQ